jgi:hypothetical protein
LACRDAAKVCDRHAASFTEDQTPDASANRGDACLGRQKAAAQGQHSSYASVTGEASSYARVHGEVSRAPADWTEITSVAREVLEDVRYHKAEGIAKVSQ